MCDAKLIASHIVTLSVTGLTCLFIDSYRKV